MDASSQQVILILNALATAVDRLQAFGYTLYLETQAPSWTQPRSVSISGEGFQIFQNQQTVRFDRALEISCAVQCDAKDTRLMSFSILFAWDADSWFIQSMVEEEDSTRDQMTILLWESPAYRATTIDTAMRLLRQALDQLMECVTDGAVAAIIGTIERR
jgi:hypothetical protein